MLSEYFVLPMSETKIFCPSNLLPEKVFQKKKTRFKLKMNVPLLQTMWDTTWLFKCRTHTISQENTWLQVSFFLIFFLILNGFVGDLSHILHH